MKGFSELNADELPFTMQLAVKLVGTRLGEDLDSSVAELVVLGGERILVDADLADRRLRWKLSGGKTINVNLAAIRSRRRSSQRFQLRLQFIGIVRKRVEVFAFKHDRSRAVFRTHGHRRRFFLHLDVLLLNLDLQLDVEVLGLPGIDLYVGFLIQGKAFGDGGYRIRSRRKSPDFVNSVVIALDRRESCRLRRWP